MNMVNGYILYRLMVDKNEKPRRHSLMPTTVYDQTQLTSPSMAKCEPFCSPVAPHVPIRERLSSRRCTSVDAGNEADQYLMCSSNPYLAGRRRRMSLLQTLRYQNKQLTDSAFDSPRSVGNKSERDISPTGGDLLSHHSRRSAIESPPSSQFQEELILNKSSNSPSALSFSKLKAKTKALFGKRSVSEKKSLVIERRYTASDAHGRCYPTDSLERSMYSRIDFSAKERNHSHPNIEPSQQQPGNGHRQWKSPAITNDSGRGSQARLYADENAQQQLEYQPGDQRCAFVMSS